MSNRISYVLMLYSKNSATIWADPRKVIIFLVSVADYTMIHPFSIIPTMISLNKQKNSRMTEIGVIFMDETPNQSLFTTKESFLHLVCWTSRFIMQSVEIESLINQMKEMKLIKAAEALEASIPKKVQDWFGWWNYNLVSQAFSCFVRWTDWRWVEVDLSLDW